MINKRWPEGFGDRVLISDDFIESINDAIFGRISRIVKNWRVCVD